MSIANGGTSGATRTYHKGNLERVGGSRRQLDATNSAGLDGVTEVCNRAQRGDARGCGVDCLNGQRRAIAFEDRARRRHVVHVGNDIGAGLVQHIVIVNTLQEIRTRAAVHFNLLDQGVGAAIQHADRHAARAREHGGELKLEPRLAGVQVGVPAKDVGCELETCPVRLQF